MIHLGDITKIDWSTVHPVDVVTGGSPCQDLSVAGKRKGLAGERSGLYMEQIRCVKELRRSDAERGRTGRLIRPRYMVWENVPGAFSSNKGEDFRAVLEEAARVVQPDAVIPRPAGKWSNSGAIVGDGWSLAWRVHDAQFWGVPQRRRRISLVVDFGGESAPEILFERKGLSWDSEPSGTPGEKATTAVGGSIEETGSAFNPWDSQSARVYPDSGKWHSLNANENGGQSRDAVFCLQGNGIDRADSAGCNGKGWREDVSYTLNTIDRPAVAFSFDSLASNSMKSKNPNSGCREVEVSKTLDCFDPNPSKNQGGIAVVQKVYDAGGNGDGKTVCTITDDHESRVADYTALCIGNGQTNQSIDDKAGALNCMHDQQAVMVLPFDTTQITSPQNRSSPHYGDPCHPLAAQAHAPSVVAVDCRNLNESDVSGTLQSKQGGGYSLNYQNPVRTNSVVRRLTHLECERLQGYPDGWTDIFVERTVTVKRYDVEWIKTEKCVYSTIQDAMAAHYAKVNTENPDSCDDYDLDEYELMDEYDPDDDIEPFDPRDYGFRKKKTLIGSYEEVQRGWFDSKGKWHKEADSPRYKALGNSIALPFWHWLLRRISAQYVGFPTLGSLFDGIGGFPLCWERINGKGTALWASEIEEFPMAVTKVRFG